MNCKYPDNNSNEDAISSRRYDPDCDQRKVGCCDPRKYCKVDPKPILSPCPYPILFDVAKNNSVIKVDPEEYDSHFQDIRLVTIKRFDTCCLNFPIIKLDFNAILSFELKGEDARLSITFDIVKTCADGDSVIDTFTLTEKADLDSNESIELQIPINHVSVDSSYECCRSNYKVVVSSAVKDGCVYDVKLSDIALSAFAKSNY